MQDNERLSKRITLCATLSGEHEASRLDGKRIWHTEIYFFWARRHLKRSKDDEGNSLDGYFDASYAKGVRIRFQHDEDNTHPYAGRASFEIDGDAGFELAAKLHKAIQKVKETHGWRSITRERLVEATDAVPVEYAANGYNRYRRVYVMPGDSPLETLARQAL
jgi:hypothetical protein